jgi:hypothetical protein
MNKTNPERRRARALIAAIGIAAVVAAMLAASASAIAAPPKNLTVGQIYPGPTQKVGTRDVVSNQTWEGAEKLERQWFRCSEAGTECVAATPKTTEPYYSVTYADSGYRLAAEVTASNSSGSTTVRTPLTSVVPGLSRHWYSCHKKSAEGGSGFTNSGCGTATASGAKYESQRVAGPPESFVTSKGVGPSLVITSVNEGVKFTVTCQNEADSATLYVGISNFAPTFTNCVESPIAGCTIEGGAIQFKPMNGVVVESGASWSLRFEPPGEEIASFEMAGCWIDGYQQLFAKSLTATLKAEYVAEIPSRVLGFASQEIRYGPRVGLLQGSMKATNSSGEALFLAS